MPWGPWELAPASPACGSSPRSSGCPCFCADRSTHLGSVSSAEFSAGPGITIPIGGPSVMALVAIPLSLQAGEVWSLPEALGLGSHPPRTHFLSLPLAAALGPGTPVPHRQEPGAPPRERPPSPPTGMGPPQQASKITIAQKAWNVFGLIFGIAVGNSPGQM